MKTSKFIILAAFSTVALLAGCEKVRTEQTGVAPAIKVNISKVETKAKVISDKVGDHSDRLTDFYDFIETNGFNISAYVTADWKRDQVGDSPVIKAGIYVDPGFYEGPYDESTYPDANNKLKDIKVTYDSSRGDEKWRITGNESAGYANHKFSWVNNIPMNFFAYAPVSPKGTYTAGKSDTSTDGKYPFAYAAKATDGTVNSTDCDDLIFAYTQHTAAFEDDRSKANYGKIKSTSSDKFNLTFYHALAQIRFCVSTSDDTYDPNIKLRYVKLGGVESSGTFSGLIANGSCTFEMSSSATSPSDYFTWGAASTPAYAYYYQKFNGDAGVSFASGTPTGWELGSYGTSPNEENLYTCIGDVLFVIPQSLSNCAVEVGIQEGTGDVQIMKGHLPATTSSSTNVSWEAGKYYTYKIKAGKEFGLTLLSSEWIDGSPAGGLQF